MRLLATLQENRPFFILHTLLLLGGIYPWVVFDKVTLFLKLNSFHHPFLDQFFYYITFLGSSTMYALLMATFVGMKLANRTLVTGISSFVAMSAIVQGMKRSGFFDQLRPIALLPRDAPLHLVEGIVPQTHLSFPSGHASTIFTAVCLIHLLVRKKPFWFSVFLLLGAAAVAYSRVYLCQHFYRDIYVGALVGTCTATLVYVVLMNWQGPYWLDQRPMELLHTKLKRKA